MAELDPRRWKALAVVCAAYFMTILDVAIVNVALPTIGKDLNFSRDNLQWVVTAYAITFGGFLLLGGRAADILGRRRVFLAGVILFTTASLFCGLAWSEGVLIGARAVQGFGAAVISPAALSIITTTFEEGAERNKALGVWGAMGGSGAAVGVLLGGVLTKYAGWEWIFFINIPVGVIAFLLAPRFVRESRDDTSTTPDVAGAVTVTAGIALLVYAVSNAPVHGWGSGCVIARLVVSAALILAFLAIEARAKEPLMPFSIFRIRTVAGANATAFMLGAVTFANFFVLTLYVQQVLHYSALKTGVTFAVTAVSAVVWAGLSQYLTTKVGAKPVMIVGFVAFAIGIFLYTQISADGSFVGDLLPGYLVVGFALPFTFIPISVAALAGVKPAEAGLASGLFNTSQQVGGAIGVALVSSVSISHFNHLTGQGVPFAQAFTSGAQWAFWVMFGISLAALLAAVTLIKRDEVAPVGAAEVVPAEA